MSSAAAKGKEFSSAPGVGSGWKANLLVFGTLILLVIIYFSWQGEQARRGFLKRATDRSMMLARIISFSLNNAISSQQSLEQTIHDFLASTAEFTDYLDSFEPFSSEELTAFAEEAKLVGIKIIHTDGRMIEGPVGRLPSEGCAPGVNPLRHYSNERLYVLSWPRSYKPGCIMVGIDSGTTEKLMAQIGSEQLMSEIGSLPLIEYIRLEPGYNTEATGTKVRQFNNKSIAETRITFDNANTLVVGIDASHYIKRLKRLRGELLIFSAILLCLGLFFSWLLYRHQRAYLERVREFERQMARQREEAALGRATATISHEVKNPLNAIGIGLQRLELELDTPEEYSRLISSMRKALSRTSDIISALKRHSQPISPRYRQICPHDLIEAVITLYSPRCRENNISLRYGGGYKDMIMADEVLLGQVVENLLKNAVEAQPDSGRIEISTKLGANGHFIFEMENPGFTLEAAEAEKIFEPYYTEKAKGTGLGLAISRRIVEAHGGHICQEVLNTGILKITVEIPVAQVEN